jgi:hypothetical protein
MFGHMPKGGAETTGLAEVKQPINRERS